MSKNLVQFIEESLKSALAPSYLEVIDEGDHHRGHANQGAGHFAVKIASAAFDDRSLVECHRMVYAALGNTVGGDGIHALRIEIVKDS